MSTQPITPRAVLASLLLAGVTLAQPSPSTAPAGGAAPSTRPAGVAPKAIESDPILTRMLSPTAAAARPLQPLPDPPKIDATSGQAVVAPRAPQLRLTPEGTYLTNRLARLSRAKDGKPELLVESDGQGMQDAPLIILPNRMLTSMENELKVRTTPTRFRVSGLITEYGDRNYILIDKVVPEQHRGINDYAP